MTSSLRDQVAAIVREARLNQVSQTPYTDYADRILAIPEIAEALHLKKMLEDTKALVRERAGLSPSISTHSDPE